MRYFLTTDSENYPQNLRALCHFAEVRIEADNSACKMPEVKSRTVGDFLSMFRIPKICVASGNGLTAENSYCLRLAPAESSVIRPAISGKPTRSHVQVHQTCEPTNIQCTGNRTSSQSPELLDVYGLGSFRFEDFVQILRVAYLVEVVTGNLP